MTETAGKRQRKGMLGRLTGDERGVAAVEFALIVPILLVLYFITLEVAQAIDTNKKVNRVASQVADLITQQPTMTPDEVDAIMKISRPILEPYRRSEAEVIVTAIRVTDEDTPKAEVAWSRRYSNGSYSRAEPAGTVVTIPDSLMTRDAFYVRAETKLEYWPVIGLSAQELGVAGVAGAMFPINMSERYYLRARQTRTIPCNAC